MDVVLFGSLLNTLLPQIVLKMKEARELRIAIRIDIDYVHRELRMMNALLDKGYILAKSTGSRKIIELDSQVRVLCQDTHDCIQEFLNRKDASRTEFGMKIKEFRSKVDQVYNGFQHKLPLLQEKVCRQPPYPYVDSKHLVGMGEPLDELLELVATPSERRLKKVISIVGFGGLGKTLLAREVYKSQDCKKFLTRARVTAAGKPVEEILKDILKQVGPPASCRHDESVLDSEQLCEQLCEELQERLTNEKYFIVIDDMQRTEQWNLIKYAFPNDVDSIIIVTTTMQTVANACSKCINGYVYKLSPLDVDKSQNLFSQECPSIDPGCAADMLEKCDGLPLAVVSVAHILHSLDGSTGNFRNLGAYLLEEGSQVPRLQWVLMNKYIGLSSHDLRSCLLYFSMYKQNMGAVPGRNSLLRRWQAEGFVDAQTGSKNLQTLIDCNIIWSTAVGTNGTTRRCRLPGVMLEYISQISKSDNFAALVSECGAEEKPTNRPKRIRRLSFNEDSGTDDRIISAMDLTCVLTLAVSGNGSEAILDFPKYELLGVLDLKECTNVNDDHVRFICRLLLLKYLSLGESIGFISRDIGKLQQLETLEIRTSETVKVYREILKLPKLKHLLGMFQLMDKLDKDLENFLSRDSALETVTGFVTRSAQGFPQLMCHMIKRLRKVKIYCTPTATETDQKDLQTEIQAFTRECTNKGSRYRSLSVDFADFTHEKMCSSRPATTVNPVTDKSMPLPSPLEFLTKQGSIDSLKLRGDWTPFFSCPENRRHNWRTFVSAIPDFTKMSGIKKLCLSHTHLRGKDIIAGLATLGALEYLKLEEQELGPLEINSETFKGLIRLCLAGVQRLHGITIQQQPETLPSLVSIHLICEALDPGLESLIGLGFPRRIKEIALHSGVNQDIKKAWKAAAMKHPNWPNVVWI